MLPNSIIVTNQLKEKLTHKMISSIKFNQIKSNDGRYSLDHNVKGDNFNKVVNQKIIEVNSNVIILDNNFAIAMRYDNGGLRYYKNINELPNRLGIRKHKTATYIIDVILNDNSIIELIINNWTGLFMVEEKSKIDFTKKLNPYEKTNFSYKEFVKHFNKSTALLALFTTTKGIFDISRNTVHEVLYLSNIHPMTKASSLSKAAINILYKNFINVVNSVVLKNGTSTFIDIYGNKGKYEYSISSKKKDTMCEKCNGVIRKGSAYGSTYYYCSGCQIKK